MEKRFISGIFHFIEEMPLGRKAYGNTAQKYQEQTMKIDENCQRRDSSPFSIFNIRIR